MYSRFVRRVDRSKAGKPDGVRFEFEKHYPHFESSLQDPRRVFLLQLLVLAFVYFTGLPFLAFALLSFACAARRSEARTTP